MKATVHVSLKTGVLDPQGQAIEGALDALGFDGVKSVRQGKQFQIELATESEVEARSQLNKMCEKLLANTVIENYDVQINLDSGQ
jgi:phosphoribosylformylglycinamidine synthase